MQCLEVTVNKQGPAFLVGMAWGEIYVQQEEPGWGGLALQAEAKLNPTVITR
jgi:hypothetical protein